jgi:phosphotransferase system enzyme I (PtsI)
VNARPAMQKLVGIGVSDGIAVGRAVVVANRAVEIFRIPLREDEVEREVERFRSARKEVRHQIDLTRRGAGRLFGEELSAIFEAHTLLLEDRTFIAAIEKRIAQDKVNAEWAVHETSTDLARRFSSVHDDYLRERGEDLEDVVRQLLRTLQGIAHHEVSEVEGDVILVADDLVPSEAIRLGRANVVGFAIEAGGRTSHTSIIARSLGIPAVAVLPEITDLVTDEDPIIVDGRSGTVILHPTPEVLASYRTDKAELESAVDRVLAEPLESAVSLDGIAIDLLANIDLPEELAELQRCGAQGIGLYRSEFLYMETDPRVPSEEDHYRIYRQLVEAAAPHPATIRTYDLGGRKLAREMMGSDEENPVLGLRGIRLTLARPKMFRTQLRGLLRAGAHGDLWLMAPMVSRIEEVRLLRALLEEISAELDAQGFARAPSYRLGIMIEVPAAALIADMLAREVDFFSIGTNDLIQYSLAVDRNNRQVADLYQPLHPAILRMLRSVAESGRAAGIPVSLCGEMASDAHCLPVVLGLGLRKLSAHPRSLPVLARRIRQLDLGCLEPIARQCCELSSTREVEELLRRSLPEPASSREL